MICISVSSINHLLMIHSIMKLLTSKISQFSFIKRIRPIDFFLAPFVYQIDLNKLLYVDFFKEVKPRFKKNEFGTTAKY